MCRRYESAILTQGQGNTKRSSDRDCVSCLLHISHKLGSNLGSVKNFNIKLFCVFFCLSCNKIVFATNLKEPCLCELKEFRIILVGNFCIACYTIKCLLKQFFKTINTRMWHAYEFNTHNNIQLYMHIYVNIFSETNKTYYYFLQVSDFNPNYRGVDNILTLGRQTLRR